MSSRNGEHSCWSAANGELHLAFDADGAGDAKLLPRLDRVLEQRGLADARLSVQHQDAAAAVARGLEQPVEHLALALAAEQVLSRPASRWRLCAHAPSMPEQHTRVAD